MTSVATFPIMTSSMPKTTMQTTVSFSNSEFLSNFKELLTRNIVPCDELYNKLIEENLLLPTMVVEIKALPTVEEKNKRLLDLLSIRGGNWLDRFSDILHLSGHTLLADTIRDELSGASVVVIDGKEIFKRFPKLQKFLRDVEKEELNQYLINRVREEALRQSWKRDVKAADKQKALEAKKMQIEEALRHSEVLKDKDNTIKGLQEHISKLEQELDAKGTDFKNFSKTIEQKQGEREKQLDTQMKFNIANDKTIRRLTDREIEGNRTLNQMTEAMEDVLEKYQVRKPASSFSRKMTGKSRSSGADSDWNISPLDTARWTLDKVIKMIGNLATYREKYDQLHQERLDVLKVLAVSPDEVLQASAADIVATHMKANQDQIDKLQKEIDFLLAKELEKENKPSGEVQPDSLTESIETLATDLKLKDAIIKRMKDENQKLRTQLGELKVRIAQAQAPKEKRFARPPTPFLINAPPTDSVSPAVNLDAESDSSSEVPAMHILGGPGSKPQPPSNKDTQQSALLPPLNKHITFKLGQGRNAGYSYGNKGRLEATKTTHSMTTGATQISRNSTLSNSVPNTLLYKPVPKPRILEISSYANRPVGPNQFGIQKSLSKQQNVESKRNTSFFR